MSATYWYVLDLNPIPWRVGPVGASRSASTGKVKGYVGRDQELRNYQDAIRAELAKKNPILVDGKIKVTMWFWRNQARYATEKRAKGAGNQEADGTNMYKATEDACQKILFPNDRANVSGHFYVVEQGPDVTGKVIICVETTGFEHMEEVLQTIPDPVYEEAFPSGQLGLNMEAAHLDLAPDGSKYSDADPIF
jgi:Holliday junction resolvase RusA-like endonuclease